MSELRNTVENTLTDLLGVEELLTSLSMTPDPVPAIAMMTVRDAIGKYRASLQHAFDKVADA